MFLIHLFPLLLAQVFISANLTYEGLLTSPLAIWIHLSHYCQIHLFKMSFWFVYSCFKRFSGFVVTNSQSLLSFHHARQTVTFLIFLLLFKPFPTSVCQARLDALFMGITKGWALDLAGLNFENLIPERFTCFGLDKYFLLNVMNSVSYSI